HDQSLISYRSSLKTEGFLYTNLETPKGARHAREAWYTFYPSLVGLDAARCRPAQRLWRSYGAGGAGANRRPTPCRVRQRRRNKCPRANRGAPADHGSAAYGSAAGCCRHVEPRPEDAGDRQYRVVG